MLIGLWLALLAGSLVGLQNIFNSRVHERTGSWLTTTLVLGLGFLASFLIGLAVEGRRLFHLEHMELWYWFSGMVGVGIVVCMVNAIKRLGPTYTISVVMCSQLLFAMIWDSFGWMGLAVVPFTWKQLVGVLVIASGILLFKFGGLREIQPECRRGEEA